jgi:hypothetical protein
MPDTGPYSQDVLTRIFNVHWAAGLAVEFGDKAKDAPGMEPPSARLIQIKKRG